MRKGSVAFANFILTFGEEGGLLENYELALPAFTTDTFVREYGKTNYHFYDVAVTQIDDVDGTPVVVVSGHFVKDTLLDREQIYEAGQGLVSDRQSMRSAPSAYFVLVLNTHRLVYFAETGHAPELSTFEATVVNFLRRVRENRVREIHSDSSNQLSLAAIRREIPRPTLTVVPLSEADQIAAYIQRFARIERVRLRLIKPNEETDASTVVAAVRERFGPLAPRQLDINIQSSDGLDRDAAIKAVEETAQSGNTDIKLVGEDAEGTKLEGSNDKFALTTELNEPAAGDANLRYQLYKLYGRFVAAGKIKVQDTSEKALKYLAQIVEAL